jgi:L-ascorbate metabolism protein UlaG (beta-lactamase superfamily)
MKRLAFLAGALAACLGIAGCASAPPAPTPAPEPPPTETPVSPTATLEFIGHSCFLLTASDGTRIVLDPYKDYTAPREIQMFPPGMSADAVVITHFHPDHTNSEAVAGARVIYRTGTDSVGAVRLTGLTGDHGSIDGTSQGLNTVWVLDIGALKIVHTGANGVLLTPELQAAVRNADVVIFRTGGDEAHIVRPMVDQMRELNARTLIPSHYSISEKYRMAPILTVDELLAQLDPGEAVVRASGSTLDLSAGMPKQVVVLQPSALALQ